MKKRQPNRPPLPALRDATVTMPDGRRLAYTEWGLPDGKPVLYFHGMPGSRLWCPDEEVTAAARVRLIIPDRPGIGRSDPLEGRTLADWPKDVEALANALADFPLCRRRGFCRWSVCGRVCGVDSRTLERCCPRQQSSLDRIQLGRAARCCGGMEPDEQAEFELAQKDPAAAARPRSGALRRRIRSDSTSIRSSSTRSSRLPRAIAGSSKTPSRTAIFDAHIRETWRQGLDAIKWELIDVFLPWGFRLADIAIPVTIWHGSQDPWVKQEHIDFQARTIPNCSLMIWPDSGHLGFVKHWDDILDAVV